MNEPPSRTRYALFDIPYDAMDYTQALQAIEEAARAKKVTQCCFINADCVNIRFKNEAYFRVLKEADYVWCDGTGVRWACRYAHAPYVCNLNGTDLFPKLCAYAAEKGLKLFLLGGAGNVAERCAKKMTARYEKLNIVGTRNGYFANDEEALKSFEHINGTGADIVLIGMGAPIQELFMARHRTALTIPVRIGVGGLFDFYSGDIRRAPKFMRKIGAEWLWRFLMQPRRLFKRYFIGNIVFFVHMLGMKRGRKEEKYEQK